MLSELYSFIQSLYLKNGDPCISNVIKVNRPFVWVYFASPTLIIKLVPVHTRRWFLCSRYGLWMGLVGTQETGGSSDAPARHIRAAEHPVFPLCRANKGVVVGAVWPIVATQEGNVISPDKERGELDFHVQLFFPSTFLNNGRIPHYKATDLQFSSKFPELKVPAKDGDLSLFLVIPSN